MRVGVVEEGGTGKGCTGCNRLMTSIDTGTRDWPHYEQWSIA